VCVAAKACLAASGALVVVVLGVGRLPRQRLLPRGRAQSSASAAPLGALRLQTGTLKLDHGSFQVPASGNRPFKVGKECGHGACDFGQLAW